MDPGFSSVSPFSMNKTILSCRYPLEDEEKEKEISRSYVAEIIDSWKTWNPICAPLGNRIFKVVKGYKLGR